MLNFGFYTNLKLSLSHYNINIVFKTLQPIKNGNKVSKVLRYLNIIAFAALIGSTLAFFYKPLFRYEDDIKEVMAGSIYLILFIMVLRAISYVLLRSKSSKTKSYLLLTPNEITADEMIYSLEHIKNIRFIGNDIKGEFRGFISKGTGNEMILSLEGDIEKKFYFEQTSNNRLRDQKEILEGYVTQNKLSKTNFEMIMNNTNYY